MKKEISLSYANRLINHGPLILVTSSSKEKVNIITLAWNMPVSHNPALLAIAVAKGHFSSSLIKDSGEFAINIPNWDLLEKVKSIGRVSGRDVNKFKEFNLKKLKAKRINTPLIQDCIGHLECKVISVYECGDHLVFIGEVLTCLVDEDLFEETWQIDNPRAKTIHHLGADFFCFPQEKIKSHFK